MNVRIQVRAIALLCCLLLTHWAFSQTTRYVSTTGLTPAATATSWATSTTDLQGAINASQPGDQVWVAAGVYKPTATTGPDSRTISFSMKNGVAIYGGFLGSETIFSQRPPVNPVAGHPSGSTLSGDIGIAGDAGDNSYHVISNPAGLTTTAVLDGFVITGGRANGGGSADYGGAMYNDNSSPTLTNCSLQGNSASRGGAMYNNLYSSPTLTNCSLQGNSAGLGGGAMFNHASSPTLTNCSLQGNSAESSGGAMYNSNTSSPTLTNCSLQGNSARDGGAMYNFNYSSPTLINCSLQGNSARDGGAMYNNYSSPTLTNCVLWSNGGSNTFYHLDATTRLYYSLYEPELATTDVDITGPGNLTATTSPFVSATSVALAACSPAINAGNPASATAASGPYSATALPATDLTGNVRITGPRIDMGAVEYQQQNGLPLQIVQQPVAGSVVCAGTTAVMSVSVTGSAPAYQWYRSGTALTGIASATTASLTLTSLQPADAGSYSVVISGDCPSVTSTVFSLSVNALPSVTVTAAPSATLSCATPSLTLTATASTTGLRWSTGETTTTISVSTAGTYSVIATGANGCTVVSNNLPVTENFSLPPFTVSSATVCPGQSVNLTASGCGGQILWSTGATTAMITLTAGSSTSLLTATCTAGICSTTANGQIVIGGIQPPPAQILSFTADESACPVRLTGRGVATSFTMTGPKDYVFSTVYREGATHEAVGLNVKQAGTYTLTATYTNSCGTSAPVTRTVTVSKSCP